MIRTSYEGEGILQGIKTTLVQYPEDFQNDYNIKNFYRYNNLWINTSVIDHNLKHYIWLNHNRSKISVGYEGVMCDSAYRLIKDFENIYFYQVVNEYEDLSKLKGFNNYFIKVLIDEINETEDKILLANKLANDGNIVYLMPMFYDEELRNKLSFIFHKSDDRVRFQLPMQIFLNNDNFGA